MQGGGGSTSQNLTRNDALTYLKEVKETFQDQKEKYDRFIQLIKDFNAQRTDTVGAIARVKELFKGHNHLISRLNTFLLPIGYEITPDEDEEAPPKKTLENEDATSFLNKVQQRFINDVHVYESFLDIMIMYWKDEDIIEIYDELAVLLAGHPDLLDELRKFLPYTSAAAPYGQSSTQHYNEQSSATPEDEEIDMFIEALSKILG